jgi:hypothetical protein
MTNKIMSTTRFAGWFLAVLVTIGVTHPGSLAARQAGFCYSIKTYSPRVGRSPEGQKCLGGFLKIVGNFITFGLTTSICPAETWIEPGGSYCDEGGVYRSCCEIQRVTTILTDKKQCNDRNECVVVGHGTTQVVQLLAIAWGQCGGDPPPPR